MANQGPQQDSRNIRDMLESSSPEQSFDAAEALRRKEQELAERERQLDIREQGSQPEQEKTKIVSKESLEHMVQDKTREREVVRELKEAPEAQPEVRSEDLMARKQSGSAKQQKAQVKAQAADDIALVMNLERPKQVKKLIYLALKRGVRHAYNVARGLNDAYLIDEFHDALVDQMHDELKKRKQL